MKITRRRFGQISGAALLAACAPSSAPARRRADQADVIVLGAGLSGLHAARLLGEFGFRVIVLEGASRPGGRIMTLHDIPGQPEAGGQQVGQTYARIRKTAKDLGIRLVPFPKRPRELTLHVNGRLMASSDWALAKENPFPETFRPSLPGSVLAAAANPVNPFSDDSSWISIPAAADISAQRFLEELGFGADALRLAGHTLNGNSLATYSMANLWRSLKIIERELTLGAAERIEGGAARLTDAMAASLPEGILHLNMPITELHERGSHVECVSSGKVFTAPFALCTLPFAAMRKGRMRLTLAGSANSSRQASAIANLPYTRIVQVHLIPRSPFWQHDLLPADMWTDGPIERVFANYDEGGDVASLSCWINGDGALSSSQRLDWHQLVEAEFARIRNASVRIAKVIRWDETDAFAGGAYMHWAPGQIAQWAEIMGEPSGRIYFAGEHLSFLHTGMEGAMESAERTTVRLMEAAGA